ncbi:MAG: sulfite exporter TauE/SafE family protein [Defluviitaleaceae bacterium]|nr:sulfite exporter TauE/SafE family protein [Defluviitaleaceae bacterium]
MKKLFAGLVSGIFNGLLGSGGGVVAVLALRKFFGLNAHKTHATAVAVMLPMTVVSVAVYACMYSGFDWKVALWVSLGGAIGGVLGAKLLKKISAGWLHKIFGALMVFAAIRVVVG